MSLGNSKLPYSDKSVHLARILVSEEGRCLTEAHGQIPVRALTIEIDLVLEGTSHRTQCKALLALVIRVADNKHAVEIMIPMSRNLKKFALRHERGLCKEISLALLLVLYPALQELYNSCALGEKNGQSLT